MSDTSFSEPPAANLRQVRHDLASLAPAPSAAVRMTAARPWMDRLAVNQMTTRRWSLEEDLQRYPHAGIKAIGVNWQKLNDDAIPSEVAMIRRSQLSVSSVGWCGGFTGSGLTHGEAVLDARRKLRVARQLNASALLLVSGPQSTHIRSHASRLMVDAMSQLCEAAADSPVRVAIQPMHRIFRKGWSFLHTLEESLALLDRVNSPKAGLCFGTYHLWQEPELSRTLPQIVDKIALVQLSDWREPPRCENDRTMLGDGCIPLKAIIASLESAGYCGWYEIEVWSRDLWKRKHVDLIQSCVNRYRQLQVSEASTSIAD